MDVGLHVDVIYAWSQSERAQRNMNLHAWWQRAEENVWYFSLQLDICLLLISEREGRKEDSDCDHVGKMIQLTASSSWHMETI